MLYDGICTHNIFIPNKMDFSAAADEVNTNLIVGDLPSSITSDKLGVP